MCVNVAALIINRIDCVVIKSFAWAEGSHFYVAFLPWPGPASIRAKCVPAFSLFFRRLSFLNWSSLGWQKVIWSVFRNTFADSFLFLLFKVFYFPVCLLMWLNLSFFFTLKRYWYAKLSLLDTRIVAHSSKFGTQLSSPSPWIRSAVQLLKGTLRRCPRWDATVVPLSRLFDVRTISKYAANPSAHGVYSLQVSWLLWAADMVNCIVVVLNSSRKRKIKSF